MRWSIEEALRWDVLRIHKWSAINFFLRYHKRVKLSPRIPRIVSLISGLHNNRIFLFTLLILRTLVLPEKVWWKFNGTIIPGWNLDYFIKFWCLLWYRHVLIYVWTSSHKKVKLLPALLRCYKFRIVLLVNLLADFPPRVLLLHHIYLHL